MGKQGKLHVRFFSSFKSFVAAVECYGDNMAVIMLR